jgi:hypothetical protein
MKFLTSPLIYSRTATQGFSPNFLVHPKEFSNDDKSWARSFVVPALGKADLLHDYFRFCGFQNEKYIVLGLCCMANWLCDNKNFLFVNQTRPNYGFFGYVFSRATLENFIPQFNQKDIPELFKPLYQPVIAHWEETVENSYPSNDYEIECDGIVEKNLPFPIPQKNQMVLLPQRYRFEYFSHIIGKGFSFCFNMPSIEDSKSSPFNYIFTPKYDGKAEIIEKGVKKKDSGFSQQPSDSKSNRAPVSQKKALSLPQRNLSTENSALDNFGVEKFKEEWQGMGREVEKATKKGVQRAKKVFTYIFKQRQNKEQHQKTQTQSQPSSFNFQGPAKNSNVTSKHRMGRTKQTKDQRN